MKLSAIIVILIFMPLAVVKSGTALRNDSSFPALHINGELLFPLVYYFSANPENWWEKTHKQILFYYLENGHPQKKGISNFAKAGIHLYQSPMGYGWDGGDRFDFRLTDEAASALLKIDPDAYIIGRINVDVNQLWRKRHPSEMSFPMPGNPSMYSTIWKEDLKRVLTVFLEHVKKQPYGKRVIGYILCGGGGSMEWYTHYDYSIPAQKAFRLFLKGKYKTDKTLSILLEKETVIDEIEIPKLNSTGYSSYAKCDWPLNNPRYMIVKNQYMFLDPVKDRLLSDYIQFQNEGVADAISYFAGIIKKNAGDNVLVGAWFGNVFLYHCLEARHKASYKLYNDSNVDLIVTPLQYDNRQPGGCITSQSLPASVKLNRKMLFSEEDQRTFLTERRKQDRIGNYGQSSDLKETIGVIKRNFAFTATKQSGQWWTDMRDRGDWYDHPALMETIADCGKIYKSVLGKDRSVSQIAVFVSEESFFRQKLCDEFNRYGLFYQVTANLPRLGAPFDMYFIGDLKRENFPASKYKLFIFLNAFYLSDEDRATIRKKVLCNNNTVLWFYASGFASEDKLSLASMSKLTGINFKMSDTPKKLRVKFSPSDDNKFIFERFKNGPAFDVKESLEKWPKEAYPYKELETNEFGTENPLAPVFVADDKDAVMLGTFPDSGEVGFCFKKMDNWNSIWSCAPNVPFNVLREIARFSGVHIYEEDGDQVFVSEKIVAVHAASAGEKTILLPGKYSVTDPFADKDIGKGIDRINVKMSFGETAFFLLQKSGE